MLLKASGKSKTSNDARETNIHASSIDLFLEYISK